MIAAILNFDQVDLLRSTLRQIKGLDVAVVCQGELELVHEAMKGAEQEDVRIYKTPYNMFFTGGWNWGLHLLLRENPEVKQVWMLNDDCIGLSKDLGKTLQGYLEINPQVAAVTPTFNSPHVIFHKNESDLYREVTWIDWTCPMINVEAWKKTGQFDPDFKGYGADIDWSIRARKEGYKLMCAGREEVKHLGSVTALRKGLQGEQGNTEEMDRLMRQKWGYTALELAYMPYKELPRLNKE